MRMSYCADSSLLTTHQEPPPDNYMSIPDSVKKSLGGSKRSALKIFGRQKRKRHNPSKFLRLPDSAVSAKTKSGARHIAISIPIEYDHIEEKASPLRQHPVPKHTRSSLSTGAVIVLKPHASLSPVRESHESLISNSNSGGKRDSRNIMPESALTQVDEILGTDNARTLEKYYSQMQKSDLEKPDVEPPLVRKCKPLPNYVIACAISTSNTVD